MEKHIEHPNNDYNIVQNRTLCGKLVHKLFLASKDEESTCNRCKEILNEPLPEWVKNDITRSNRQVK